MASFPFSAPAMAASPERRKIAARISAIARHKGEDDPRLPALRDKLIALSVAEIRNWAERAAATLPALTTEETNAMALHARRVHAQRIAAQRSDSSHRGCPGTVGTVGAPPGKRKAMPSPAPAKRPGEAHGEMRAISAEQRIKKLAGAAPPLSGEQRARLAALLMVPVPDMQSDA